VWGAKNLSRLQIGVILRCEQSFTTPQAGVRRIVFQSSETIVDGAEEQPNEIAAFHREIERKLEESGLEWTFLRLEVASADALQWAFVVPASSAAATSCAGRTPTRPARRSTRPTSPPWQWRR